MKRSETVSIPSHWRPVLLVVLVFNVVTPASACGDSAPSPAIAAPVVRLLVP